MIQKFNFLDNLDECIDCQLLISKRIIFVTIQREQGKRIKSGYYLE